MFGNTIFSNRENATLQCRRFRNIATISMPGVVGAVDGTHIQIIAPSKDEDVFVNRNESTYINTQIVFDATFNILDVVAKWPAGSTHDPRILMGSGLRQLFERHRLSLQDVLTPLNPQLGAQLKYNIAHKNTRNLVERGIGQMKRRFHVLHGEIRLSPERESTVITVCAILHNREQLQELYEKQQSNRSIAERWRGVQGESAGERRCRTSESSLCAAGHPTANMHAGGTPHFLPALPAVTDCWKKEEVEEEEKRLQELRLREKLIRNLGVAKKLYNMFNDAPSSRQANAPLSILTESHQLLSRMTTMLEPLAADGRTLQMEPILNVSTECGTDLASLNPPSHPPSDTLPPSGSRPKPRSEQSHHHHHHHHHHQHQQQQQQQQHQQPPTHTKENPQPVMPPSPPDSKNHQGPHQAKSELHIRAQYHPHQQFHQPLLGPDPQLQVPSLGPGSRGLLRRQASTTVSEREYDGKDQVLLGMLVVGQRSVGQICFGPSGFCLFQVFLDSCAVQSSVTMKASERHASLPTSVSLCKLGSLKTNWPFAERRSRGFPYTWPPSQVIPYQQMCHSDGYSDLHIVSGPAPINKRPNQCPIRHSETPRCL
ncbi:putative nuclease HARBI1 [Merluccius polli]|uniref:Nuclease HARBI1 n=1 Tax=Merluccius polli TaxID=89951 RepID=A0AA47P820_MERPO|nr:putative nuclease HARBI1 [Merluccius polli]